MVLRIYAVHPWAIFKETAGYKQWERNKSRENKRRSCECASKCVAIGCTDDRFVRVSLSRFNEVCNDEHVQSIYSLRHKQRDAKLCNLLYKIVWW